ncbi:MAG: M48 family peptidase [Gammaproteobacteria bacterium]|nr:MAG: M48 family peptidase [Gammaproteobacteria bacterium]
MNSFSYIFLGLLGLGIFIQLWLIQRHCNHVRLHQDQVPDAFREKISLESHQLAAHYTLAKMKLERVHVIFDGLILLAWTIGGGLQSLYQWNQAAFSGNSLTLIASFMIISHLLNLPLDYYKTFFIEQKFGFNRSTPALFFLDTIKQLILGLVLMLPLAWVILWCMTALGSLWWLAAMLVWLFFILFVTWAYPMFFAQWFNRFTEMPEGPVKDRIVQLLERSGFSSNGIFIMDGSRRSAHGNAYFTGFGKSKRIVFYDTLLEQLSEDEIEAVLAHELGHFKCRHIPKRLGVSILLGGTALSLVGFLSQTTWFFQGLGVSQPGNDLALLLFVLIAPLFSLFFQPLTAQWSRRHEFEADEYAAKTSHADYLISGLIKLYQENASTLTPDPLYSAFHDSHPPASIRISHLQADTQK